MTTTTTTSTAPSVGRKMLNKGPEVTIFFWIIKILCTTVGETFADNLNQKQIVTSGTWLSILRPSEGAVLVVEVVMTGSVAPGT